MQDLDTLGVKTPSKTLAGVGRGQILGSVRNSNSSSNINGNSNHYKQTPNTMIIYNDHYIWSSLHAAITSQVNMSILQCFCCPGCDGAEILSLDVWVAVTSEPSCQAAQRLQDSEVGWWIRWTFRPNLCFARWQLHWLNWKQLVHVLRMVRRDGFWKCIHR